MTSTTNTTTMTTRDHLNAIINGTITSDTQNWAKSQLEKLDARNLKRASKPSKTAIANQPLKEALLAYLGANDGKYTEAELGALLEVTHNKAGSLARQLVAEGLVQQEEVKIPKIGKRKVYFVR